MSGRTRPNLDELVTKHITPAETTIRAEVTVSEAVERLRSRSISRHITYFYVVDEDDRLKGVVSTRLLLLGDPKRRVADIMDTRVISIPAEMTLADALEFFAMHRLLAFPVVDSGNRLLGSVDVQLYADEVFDLAQAHRMVDLYQMVGLSIEQSRQAGPWASYRSRMPWLLCNMGGGVACAIIASFFEATLQQVIILAMFIPLVLTLSESISMQSMTLSLQFLHRPGVDWKRVLGRLHLEWRAALLLGVTSGLLVAIAVLPSGGGWHAAAVIGTSVIFGMLISALAGVVIPILLHAFRLDPRIAAGPVVLTCADVMTTFAYLGLATLLLI